MTSPQPSPSQVEGEQIVDHFIMDGETNGCPLLAKERVGRGKHLN
jgi:hypothetical protein